MKQFWLDSWQWLAGIATTLLGGLFVGLRLSTALGVRYGALVAKTADLESEVAGLKAWRVEVDKRGERLAADTRHIEGALRELRAQVETINTKIDTLIAALQVRS